MNCTWGPSHGTSRAIGAIGVALLMLTFSMPSSLGVWCAITLCAGVLFVGILLGQTWTNLSIAQRVRAVLDRYLLAPKDAPQLDREPSLDLEFMLNQLRRNLEGLEQQLVQAHAQLSYSNDRYQLLTDNLAASVIVRDIAGRITFCSPYTEVLTGYGVSEIYCSENDFFLSIIHTADKEKYQRAFKIAATGEAFQFRYRILHKTGIEMWVETRTVPVLGDDGEVSLTLSITLDVTGAVRYQRQVEEKNRDLHDFTYMVSHDLKAPIFTIKGMAAILKEDLAAALTPDTSDALDHIAKASHRLETLVSSVLEYSRVSSQEMAHEPVSLDEVLKEIRADFTSQMKAANACVRLDSNLPWVMGDRLRLYQIFGNLIGNAIKFRSPERACEVRIYIEPSRSDREIIIAVQDNGLGIPEDKRDAIFRPFHRLHGSSIEGSGIGLACVRKLLERFGGSIAVESTVGVGSTFRVSLERAQEIRVSSETQWEATRHDS